MVVESTEYPIVIADAPDVVDSRGVVYLPFVVNERPAIHNAEVFFNLLWNDSRQLRPRLTPCPKLTIAATLRAQGLALGGPWAHVDKDGVTPNEYARMAGCNLPGHYATKGNQIESLVAGSPNMTVMFNALAASESHANHMFGRLPMFQRQDKCGIAVAVGGQFGWYLVLLISECL
jgi:hypothetical protein